MLVRIYRMIPLLIVLAVVTGIVYAVASLKYTPPRAKEIVIRFLTWVNIILTAFFGLAALYALFEKNDMVMELFACFAVVTVLGLIITRICNAVFLKHNPAYRHRRTSKGNVAAFPGRGRRSGMDGVSDEEPSPTDFPGSGKAGGNPYSTGGGFSGNPFSGQGGPGGGYRGPGGFRPGMGLDPQKIFEILQILMRPRR